MEWVEAGVVGEMEVGPPFFDKIADDVEMAVEAGIKQGSESLIVLLVDPYKNFLVMIFLIE